jgi:hypothetical protein
MAAWKQNCVDTYHFQCTVPVLPSATYCCMTCDPSEPFLPAHAMKPHKPANVERSANANPTQKTDSKNASKLHPSTSRTTSAQDPKIDHQLPSHISHALT